jgi:hypothetical protein
MDLRANSYVFISVYSIKWLVLKTSTQHLLRVASYLKYRILVVFKGLIIICLSSDSLTCVLLFQQSFRRNEIAGKFNLPLPLPLRV